MVDNDFQNLEKMEGEPLISGNISYTQTVGFVYPFLESDESKLVEKVIKKKYQNILAKEVASHRTVGNVANSTLLLANFKKLKAASSLLAEDNTDTFEELCCRYLIPITGILSLAETSYCEYLVALQVLMLTLNFTHQNLEQLVDAKAMSQNPSKQQRAKWVNFCTATLGSVIGMVQ